MDNKNSKKADFITTLMTVFVFSFVFSVIAQFIQVGIIDWKTIPLNMLVGFIVGMIAATIIPAGKLGAKLAIKLNLIPGTFLFGVVVNLVFTVIFSIVMSLAMTLIFACWLGGVPVIPAIIGALKTIWIYILIGFVIGMIVVKPIQLLSAKICNVN